MAKKKNGLGGFLTLSGNVFLDGWILCLVFGGLHSAYRQVIPFGYWWCVLITYIVVVIVDTPSVARDVRNNVL